MVTMYEMRNSLFYGNIDTSFVIAVVSSEGEFMDVIS